MDAKTLAQAVRLQIGYVAYTCMVNLDGVTDEEALVGPDEKGNCINWIVGHLLHARAGLLDLLGAEPPFAKDKYERYERSSGPVEGPSGTVPLSEMTDDLAATAEPLEAALGDLTDDFLAREAPIKPTGNEDETMGSLLAGLAFHESYHAGQLGLLRRIGGREGALK
jgi:hypothetical protein